MSKQTPEQRSYTFSPTGERISNGHVSVCQNCLTHIKEIAKLRADKARLIEALQKSQFTVLDNYPDLGFENEELLLEMEKP